MERRPAKVLHSERLTSRRSQVRRETRRTVRRRRRRLTLAVVTIGVLATGGWMLARSSLFALEGIEVAGNRLLTRSDILQASGVDLGRNMLTLHTDDIESRIGRLPLVETVNVARIDTSRIRIVVVERQPAFILETVESRWFLDPSGAMLGRVGESPPELPTFRIPGEIAADTGDRIRVKSVDDALRLWIALPDWLRAGQVMVDAGGPLGLELVRPEVRVGFGTVERLGEKVEATLLLLDRARRTGEALAVIDVRAPSRPSAVRA
jgi:cell division septal protein FtsQ